MKNAVLWDVAPCTSYVNRRFGGAYRPCIRCRKIRESAVCSRWFLGRGSFTQKMEAIRSSETSVHTTCTRRHIPEDGILHSHRRENLKFYIC
jgi:hypothetical protein